MTATRLRLWTTIIIAFVLFLLLRFGVTMYTNWLWFQSLKFESVYLTSLLARVAVFFGAGVPFAIIFVGNLFLAHWFSTRDELFLGQRRALDLPIFGWLIWVTGLFLGLAVAAAASPRWLDFLRFFNRVPFGVTDPLFDRDVGFYVFTLPVYHFIQGWLITSLLMTLVGVLIIYFFAQLHNLREGEIIVLPHVRLHASALGAALFAVVAWGHRLAAFDLLYSPRGVAFGASYTDVHAELPALQAMFWLAVIIAGTLLANVALRRLWLPLIGVGVWMVVGLVIISIVPGIMQRYFVEPNELTREAPYIENNVLFTRQAYGLDNMDERDFGEIEPLRVEALETNRATLQNVRLWDYRPLAQTYRQIQEIRLYYGFTDLDIDRYWIDGDYRQVILAARELDQSQLQSVTWVNQHLQFTHGYGVVMNPVNEVTPEGLPQLWIKDLPPEISVSLTIDRPQIYYGELTTNYVFVNTGIEEFDYPRGDENVYTFYEGTGGVPLNSYLKRLAFAARLADANILLSQYIDGNSRLMFIRRIQDRVQEVAPFLRYDSDPYLAILDGKLYWIQDAYTISDRYPYAEPVDRNINYIRNAVKVVIDTYNGSMTFYVADPNDPLVQTYAAIYPNLFTSQDAMPDELREHLRYPEGLFRIQATMYQTYHMRDVNVFYNKEDLWNLPREVFSGQDQPVEPYYVIIRLPGEGSQGKEEFMLIQPFTPATKDNLIAWMAGRSDGEHYGQLVVYRFPKQELIFGPLQIEARVDQDPEISAQLSLWSQRGSQVIRGNLLVIPMERSLLYVEPLYLQAESGQIPELKRVIVASGERVIMAETLADGLVRLFPEGELEMVAETIGVSASKEEPPASDVLVTDELPSDLAQQVYDLARQADEHYMAAQEALRAGDWATYGTELDAMERVLKQLVDIAGPPAE
jgi:uncharacterized membrane protein (UPF0182 family)